MAELRLVLEVEVASGKEHTAKHAAPGLWALLDRLGAAMVEQPTTPAEDRATQLRNLG